MFFLLILVTISLTIGLQNFAFALLNVRASAIVHLQRDTIHHTGAYNSQELSSAVMKYCNAKLLTIIPNPNKCVVVIERQQPTRFAGTMIPMIFKMNMVEANLLMYFNMAQIRMISLDPAHVEQFLRRSMTVNLSKKKLAAEYFTQHVPDSWKVQDNLYHKYLAEAKKDDMIDATTNGIIWIRWNTPRIMSRGSLINPINIE
jgi:hypothetical protein